MRAWPFFLLLLPFFFMLHMLNENFAPGLGATVLEQVFLYFAIALVLNFFFFLLLKEVRKAALVSLFLLSFNFFFGSLHDGLKSIAGEQIFLAKYVFIVPLIIILTAALVIGLKRTKKDISKVYLFLNILLFTLFAFEWVQLLPKIFQKNNSVSGHSQQFIDCDTCKQPDVYVIIADEYAGRQELKDVFSFDNTTFETELGSRGFHLVNNSRSNYNATVYSMASLFNTGYINLSVKTKVTQGDILLCTNLIDNSRVGSFFQSRGYTISNYSFFDFQDRENAVISHLFSAPGKIITDQTFVSRFAKEAGFNFFSKVKIKIDEGKDYYENLRNDEKIDSLTKKTVLQDKGKPKFVYAHFARPHAPFYFNREGKPFTADSHLQGFARKKIEYTEYLLYTNKQLLNLVDHIVNESTKPPVILLASDHGCRFLPGEVANEYNFMNLCAVLLPGSNYEQFYNGMSTVNTFRAILNSTFGQQLAMQKDSTVYLQLDMTK